jgi:hypothetical protein
LVAQRRGRSQRVRSKASACGASAFYVQAQAAKVGARVVGIHSVNPLHDGKVSCWFDIDKTNENEGIIICHIDQAELMQWTARTNCWRSCAATAR